MKLSGSTLYSLLFMNNIRNAKYEYNVYTIIALYITYIIYILIVTLHLPFAINKVNVHILLVCLFVFIVFCSVFVYFEWYFCCVFLKKTIYFVICYTCTYLLGRDASLAVIFSVSFSFALHK